jgi:hypothetical protein
MTTTMDEGVEGWMMSRSGTGVVGVEEKDDSESSANGKLMAMIQEDSGIASSMWNDMITTLSKFPYVKIEKVRRPFFKLLCF